MHADALRYFYGYHVAEKRTLWDRYVVQRKHHGTNRSHYSNGSEAHTGRYIDMGQRNCQCVTAQMLRPHGTDPDE